MAAYLVTFVVDESFESATPFEMSVINAFNERLREHFGSCAPMILSKLMR